MYQSINIKFHEYGPENGPLMVCVHGIMGNSQDFAPFKGAWGKEHRLIIPDLLPGSKTSGDYSASTASGDVLVYTLGPQAIADYMEKTYPQKPYYLMGISFGGKICFEIAQNHPERVVGVSVTDVGLGHLCRDSDLFKLVFDVIPTLDLNQPWKSLRKDIASAIPDRMLRVLIHNHIIYPEGTDKYAAWKPGTKNFYSLLKSSNLEDQWPEENFFPVPATIFKSTINSAIDERDFERMKTVKNIQLDVIDDSNHFIHVHKPDLLREKVYENLMEVHPPSKVTD